MVVSVARKIIKRNRKLNSFLPSNPYIYIFFKSIDDKEFPFIIRSIRQLLRFTFALSINISDLIGNRSE